MLRVTAAADRWLWPAHLEVLEHAELRKHETAFGDERDAPADHDVARAALDRLAVEADAAGLRDERAGDRLDGGGLAGAVGAQKRDHLARADLERDPAHGGDAVIGVSEVGDGQVRPGAGHGAQAL
jgi:hypothetical protein